MITIYHNAKCSKSRECLAFLEDSKQEFHVIKYIDNPLSVEELTEIIRKLNIKPIGLVRQKEPIWIERFKDKKMTPKKIIEAMAKYPILIERPIAVHGDKAVIARPLEKINGII